MSHLLDVNLLISAIVHTHSNHMRACAWLADKSIVICPIVELGFLRITTQPRTGIGLTMPQAREVLHRFMAERNAERIPDDLPALESHPKLSKEVTDFYLADLAARHGLKLATLDAQLKHSVAVLVS